MGNILFAILKMELCVIVIYNNFLYVKNLIVFFILINKLYMFVTVPFAHTHLSTTHIDRSTVI
jgi:hypothetical protein